MCCRSRATNTARHRPWADKVPTRVERETSMVQERYAEWPVAGRPHLLKQIEREKQRFKKVRQSPWRRVGVARFNWPGRVTFVGLWQKVTSCIRFNSAISPANRIPSYVASGLEWAQTQASKFMSYERAEEQLAPASTQDGPNDLPRTTVAHRGYDAADSRYYDVVVIGGGLAGLTLARHVRQVIPQWSIAVVERQPRPIPEAAWKVGESSVEVGSRYLEELGLSEYLLKRQLVKFGLRFFPGGGHLGIHERTEVGPSQEPIVKSYQLDRGRFEADLRGLLEEDGVTLLEGYKATELAVATHSGRDDDAANPRHSLTAVKLATPEGSCPSERLLLTCRWLVDASGREAVMHRNLGLREPSGHTAHAGWFRVQGKVDINDWVGDVAGGARWHREDWKGERWRSTNHLMGKGYWCWIIPLASGNTSIGVVVHEEYHAFTTVNTLDACLRFLSQHEPQMCAEVQKHPVMDFRCLRGYSHGAHDLWSPQRYAVVGEAGAFVDPLYSPGSDFIAFANSFTLELMRRDLEAQPLDAAALAFNERYKQLVQRAVELYRYAGPVYGHASAMAAKVYFDNFGYWSFFAQYFFQKFYADLGPKHDEYVNLGVQIADLSRRVQALLRTWALNTESEASPTFIGMPRFPSLLVDVYMDLREARDLEAAIPLLRRRVEQSREIAAELAFRVLLNAGPNIGPKLLAGEATSPQAIDLSILLEGWGVTRARVEAEFLPSLTRRKRLAPAARDVERTLGRIKRHPAWNYSLQDATKHLEPVGQTSAI
jgi:flavin-dependent dehydrogenase